MIAETVAGIAFVVVIGALIRKAVRPVQPAEQAVSEEIAPLTALLGVVPAPRAPLIIDRFPIES